MRSFGSAGPAVPAALVTFGMLAHAMLAGATTYNVATVSGLINAVAAANANLGPDTINMAPGLYVLGPLYTPLYVTDDLTVNGGGRPGTILDGTGVGGAAFSVRHRKIQLRDFARPIHRLRQFRRDAQAGSR